MSKHTPGPWRYIPGMLGAKFPPAVQRGSEGGFLVEGVTREQEDADARLISAAPDLLEALEAFLRAPSVGSSGPGSATIVVQDFNLRAARAAIAKATGAP